MKGGEIEMTKQEAIETIRMAIAQVEWEYPMDYAAAFDMAIEALSQPEIIRCQDCIHYRYYGLAEETVSECRIGHCENQHKDWFCADGERR